MVVNAHRINAGQPPVFGEHPDFFLFPADEPEATAERVVDLVAQRIPPPVRHPARGTSRCWRRCTAARPAPAP